MTEYFYGLCRQRQGLADKAIWRARYTDIKYLEKRHGDIFRWFESGAKQDPEFLKTKPGVYGAMVLPRLLLNYKHWLGRYGELGKPLSDETKRWLGIMLLNAEFLVDTKNPSYLTKIRMLDGSDKLKEPRAEPTEQDCYDEYQNAFIDRLLKGVETYDERSYYKDGQKNIVETRIKGRIIKQQVKGARATNKPLNTAKRALLENFPEEARRHMGLFKCFGSKDFKKEPLVFKNIKPNDCPFIKAKEWLPVSIEPPLSEAEIEAMRNDDKEWADYKNEHEVYKKRYFKETVFDELVFYPIAVVFGAMLLFSIILDWHPNISWACFMVIATVTTYNALKAILGYKTRFIDHGDDYEIWR